MLVEWSEHGGDVFQYVERATRLFGGGTGADIRGGVHGIGRKVEGEQVHVIVAVTDHTLPRFAEHKGALVDMIMYAVQINIAFATEIQVEFVVTDGAAIFAG